MHSIMWWIIFTSLLVLEVRSDHYVKYYAETSCNRYKNDSIIYNLSSGHSSSAIIRATKSLSYSYPFNCNITVSVRNREDAHVLLRVKKISFPSRTNCKNYVKIYESEDKGYQLCTKDDISYGKTDFTRKDRNEMKFLYHTESYEGSSFGPDDFFSTGFEILATAYTYAPCKKDLSFLCDNGRCISKKLVRDGYDNCGDNSDEYRFSVKIRLPINAIVGSIIGVLLVIAAISGTVWLFKRNKTTTTRTYTTPAQPIYPAVAQPYPQAPAQYAPYPAAQNAYGGENYQKSEPYPQQYGGMSNPNYGQAPPPYQ